MSGLADLQISTLGLLGQSARINTIGNNVVNVNTDGFRRSDTQFRTLVSDDFTNAGADFSSSPALNSQADSGGVQAFTRQLIDQQGTIRGTDGALDLAISGDGFFAVSPTLDVSGDIQFTRQGALQLAAGPSDTAVNLAGEEISFTQGFLSDPGGNFILGVTADSFGNVPPPTTANLGPLRLDTFAFLENGVPTTSAALNLNLPANTAGGDAENFLAEIVASDLSPRSLSFDFTNSFVQENVFDFSISGDGIADVTFSPGAPFSFDAATAGSGQLVDFQTGGPDTITIRNNTGSDAVPIANGPPVPGAFAGLSPGDTISIAGSSFADPSVPSAVISNDGTFIIESISADFSTIALSEATPLNATLATFTGALNPAGVSFTSPTSVAQSFDFGNDGFLDTPQELDIAVTFDDGATASFNLDVSGLTQFGTSFAVGPFSQNGAQNAELLDFNFDDAGLISGEFSDGTVRTLGQIPLATFANTNGLQGVTGQIFEQTEVSGAPSFGFVNETESASFVPNALEGSNVDITEEFGLLIQAQQAYSFATQSFQIQNELLQEANELGQS